MPSPVITEIRSAGGVVRSVSLFAVRHGIAGAIIGGTSVAIHVTGVRISRVDLGGIIALILSGDGSADQRSCGQGAGADRNAIPRSVTARIAAMPVLISPPAMARVTMTTIRMADPLKLLG